VVLSRIKALTWNGTFFALSFLAFWVSWTVPSLQFVVCLCLYDSFLTMIDLHHSALLADLAVTTEQRTHLNFYSSFFGAFGSLSVFLSYVMWDRDQIGQFRIFCCVLALTSLLGFLFSTKRLQKLYTKQVKDEDFSG
jgi:Na+/melibiose symporter-like transporter